LAKGLLDHIVVKTCPNDGIGGPVHLVGNQDVFSKSFDVLADPLGVLAQDKTLLSLMLFNGQVVEIFGKMELLTGFVVMLLGALGIRPVGFLALELAAQVIEGLLELGELPVESLPLLGGCSRVVDGHHGSVPTPVLARGAEGHEESSSRSFSISS
jgi:hypothetical protein